MKYLVKSYAVSTIDKKIVCDTEEEVQGYPKLDGYDIVFYKTNNDFTENNEIVAIFQKTNVYIKKIED